MLKHDLLLLLLQRLPSQQVVTVLLASVMVQPLHMKKT
jgi:hypothetical protein